MTRGILVSTALAALLATPAPARAQGQADPALQALRQQVQQDGPKAAGALMAALADRTAPTERFFVLDLLAQLHHEAALPEMAKLLEEPSDELAWQRMFVFGKMGKLGVPTLVASLQSPSAVVRRNAVRLLGPWIAAPEAVEPLRALFWREQDPELQIAVLEAIEVATPGIDEVARFSRDVVARAKGKPVQYAQEAIDNAATMRFEVEKYRLQKAPDAAAFKKELRALMESAGREGDYGRLRTASAAGDEPALQGLRERILQRGSDEAFDDYAKVTRIMLFNRLIAAAKGK
jgi:hypothetical protein